MYPAVCRTRSTQLNFPASVQTWWVEPNPAWPDRGALTDDSCDASSSKVEKPQESSSAARARYKYLSTVALMQARRFSSAQVPRYRSTQAPRANQIQLTKSTPTRTRMQRRPSRFSMSCPILPQHQSPPLPSSSNVTPRDRTPLRLGLFVSMLYQSTNLSLVRHCSPFTSIHPHQAF